MFMPERLANGHLVVPRRAVSEDGHIRGDAMVEIGPDDKEYWDWIDWLSEYAPISDREKAFYRNLRRPENPPQNP